MEHDYEKRIAYFREEKASITDGFEIQIEELTNQLDELEQNRVMHEKAIHDRDRQINSLRLNWRTEKHERFRLADRIHELSKQVAVGLKVSDVKHIMGTRPVLFPYIESNSMIEDCKHVTAWFKQEIVKLRPLPVIDTVQASQVFLDYYPTFMSYAGTQDKAEFAGGMTKLGMIPITLGPGVCLIFHFHCQLNNWFRIQLKLANHKRVNSCWIRLRIYAIDTQKPVRVAWFNGIEVFDHEFLAVDFDSITDSLDKHYRIEMDSPDATHEQAIAMFCRPSHLLEEPVFAPAEPFIPREIIQDEWKNQQFLTMPLSNRMFSGAGSTDLIAIAAPTHAVQLHRFLYHLSQLLEHSKHNVRLVVYGMPSKEIEAYCQRYRIELFKDVPEQNLTFLDRLRDQCHEDRIWVCHPLCPVPADALDHVNEVYRECPNTAIIIPLLRGTDYMAKGGLTLISREATLIPFYSNLPASHPYLGYRREVEAADTLSFIIKRDTLDLLSFDRLYGYKTMIYQLVEIIHQLTCDGFKTIYESALCFPDCERIGWFNSEHIEQDRITFLRHWQHQLRFHISIHSESHERINPKRQPSILIIDHTLPTYDEDSGSLRMYSMIQMLVEFGMRVTFFPDNLDTRYKYRHALEKIGVEVYHGEFNIQDALAYRQYDIALISRAMIGHRYIALLKLLMPDTIILYDTVDIHFIRELRQAEIEGDDQKKQSALNIQRIELSNCVLSHRVLTVTDEDAVHLKKELPHMDYSVMPNIHTRIPKLERYDFDDSEGLVFIGNYNHPPNEDAVYAFIDQVFPHVLKKHPNTRLYLIGSHMKDRMKALHSDRIHVIGWVQEVEPEFARRKVFISYLRYGSGMKGKIGQAMSAGLPVVTTSMGAEGMGLEHEQTALVADEPLQFADAVCRLLEDKQLWNRLSKQGRAFIDENYGYNAVKAKIKALIKEVKPDIAKKLNTDNTSSSTYTLPEFVKKIDLATLHFNPFDEPVRVSIVIPVFNKALYTFNCLLALQHCDQHIRQEMIIVNNASTDETQAMVESLRNASVYVIHNSVNQGFVMACRQGAQVASGEFILFLNNDTQVMDGWLDSMLAIMDNDPEVGIVGSKLIYPDGRLQEAGGIIFNDGSGWNYGRLQSPDDPYYNKSRVVDYCSGASLMIRKHLWEQLGGFDLQLAPAYYEDTDLCFATRQAGYKVVYCHESKVVHHEGITAGTDITTGYKAFQEINKHKFIAKWKEVLTSHYKPGTSPHKAARRLPQIISMNPKQRKPIAKPTLSVLKDHPAILEFWQQKCLALKFQSFGFTDIASFYCNYIDKMSEIQGGDTCRIMYLYGDTDHISFSLSLIERMVRSGRHNIIMDWYSEDPECIDNAIAQSQQRGIGGHIRFICIQGASWDITYPYHIVIAHDVFKDLENIGSVLEVVRKHLDTKGYFLCYHRMDQEIFQPEAEHRLKELWDTVPDRYKYNHLTHQTDMEYPMLKKNEQSISIAMYLENYFHVDLLIFWGNLIETFIGNSYGFNFNVTDPLDRAFIERVHQIDESAIRDRIIKPVHQLAVLKK
ncbi:MAG: glycosyltransferase [Desulfobacterales bacterium]|nr:glycosyltransferase [Desulfobacterales bacterium]